MKPLLRLYRPYFRATLRLSIPIIVGQLGTVLMGVADTLMVGRVGKESLAAAGAANSVYFLIVLIGIGTFTAVSPLISIAHSVIAKNYKCFRYMKTGTGVAVLLSLLLGGILSLLTCNFEWFGQQPEVTVLVKPFMWMLIISTLPLLLFMNAKQFTDGLGYTRVATEITLVGLMINVGLNVLLIYGYLGFPKWGLFGAGVATLIARVYMAVTIYAYVFRSNRFISYRLLARPYSWINMQYARQILVKGLPSGFQYFFEVGAFSTAALLIGHMGTTPQAAHQVAINVASVTYMMATGLSVGGGILVGDAYGRRNRSDVIKAGMTTIALAVIFMGSCGLLFLLAKKQIVGLYADDAEVMGIAIQLLLVAALFQLSDGIQCVGLGILRGLTDVNIPTLIALFAYWIVGIPVGMLLAFYYQLGVIGIWYGLLAGLTISAILVTHRFFWLSKKLPALNQG